MPTVLIVGPYRFFFYSSDRLEPAHVHVERDAFVAKVWLHDFSVAHHTGFPAPKLRRILAVVRSKEPVLREAWDVYFSG
jgi:Domain of unknown function (DUF4160)